MLIKFSDLFAAGAAGVLSRRIFPALHSLALCLGPSQDLDGQYFVLLQLRVHFEFRSKLGSKGCVLALVRTRLNSSRRLARFGWWAPSRASSSSAFVVYLDRRESGFKAGSRRPVPVAKSQQTVIFVIAVSGGRKNAPIMVIARPPLSVNVCVSVID